MKLVVRFFFILQCVQMKNIDDFLDVKFEIMDNVTADHCICVPYWQCKEDFSGLVEDGMNIIDIRITKPTNIESCKGDFDVCCQVECGRRNANLLSRLSKNDTLRYRILGGNDQADFGEFPWMLGIIQNHVFLCGGSLIHPQVAITAAHCIFERDEYIVRAGEWNWATKSESLPFQERTSKKIIVHAKYRPESLENDIAIVILDSPFQLSENIGIVCLPLLTTKTTDECLVTGWGKSSKISAYQSILKKVSLSPVPRELCSKLLGNARLGPYFKLHTSFMCAGGNSKDTCKGDGGSPLICPVLGYPNRYEQIGIVSWGLTCGIYQTPGVYVNVAFFVDWIDEEMKRNHFNNLMYKRN